MILRGLAVLAVAAPIFLASPQVFAAPQTGADMHRVDLEHFTLWSQRELSAEDVYETRQNLQNVRREVGRSFGGFYPQQKFDVVLTDQEVFRAYSGLPGHVSGYFDGTLHLPVPSGGSGDHLKAILYHEYTHALVWLASAGHCPSWIHEGLAVDQEERIFSRRSLDPRSVIRKKQLRWKLDELDKRIDPRANSPEICSSAYDEAYAVIRFLRSSRPPADFLKWLKAMSRSGSWQNATREALNTTSAEVARDAARWILS